MARKKVTPKQFAEQAAGVRLSSHERLCAERMKVLNENINELKKEVKSLRTDMSKGKGAVSAFILIGSCIAGLIGYFKFNG